MPDECARDVRAPDCARAGLSEHVVERDLHAVRMELLDDACSARRIAHLAQRAEALVEDGGIAQVEAEHVRLGVALDGAQLHAVDDANTQLGARRRAPPARPATES